jgi:hypothetical protein
VIDEVEEFLTGARHRAAGDRVLSTILFTDIVDSTTRAVEVGDERWRELLGAHEAFAGREVAKFAGVIADFAGDGLLASFDGPARAVRCAFALRHLLRNLGLEMRAGLHTGEVERRGDRVEGWPCSRSNLLRPPGLRWAAALQLPEHARLQVDSLLAVMAALQEQLDTVDGELRRFARADERCQALQSIYGIGPILACHLLAEIGEARRFRRAEQITRLAGLDPVVDESGETRRRGHLAKAGSPHLRWALVEAAVHAHRTTAPTLPSTAPPASDATRPSRD